MKRGQNQSVEATALLMTVFSGLLSYSLKQAVVPGIGLTSWMYPTSVVLDGIRARYLKMPYVPYGSIPYLGPFDVSMVR